MHIGTQIEARVHNFFFGCPRLFPEIMTRDIVSKPRDNVSIIPLGLTICLKVVSIYGEVLWNQVFPHEIEEFLYDLRSDIRWKVYQCTKEINSVI